MEQSAGFICPPGNLGRQQVQYEPAEAQELPQVTIITPFFETGRIFEETCASLLGQSFQHWLWTIVNDASQSPEALELLAPLRLNDPRILVLDQSERVGPAAARNLAVRLSSTPYLLFLDSDDLLEPTALEKMLWCLESHPEWAMCKGFTRAFGEQSYVSTATFENAWVFLDRNPVTLTALVRRQAFLDVGGFDETMRTGLEDWDLWLRFAMHGYWGHTIPEVLDWYRRRRAHDDRWQVWTEAGIARMRRSLRRRYGRLYYRGIETISERSCDSGLVLREDAPFENRLMPDRRWLLLLSTTMPSAEVLSLLVDSGHPLTAVVLGVPADQSSKPMMERLPELFVLDHFLYPGDGVRFLLYLFRSRQFDRVIVWDDPIINGMIPLLQMHFPQVMYQTWEQVQATEPAFDGTTYSAAPPDNVSAQTFAAQAIAAYVAQKRASYPHKRFELLRRLGRFGVGLFLLKERLAYWGHRARQRLRLFVGGRTRCT